MFNPIRLIVVFLTGIQKLKPFQRASLATPILKSQDILYSVPRNKTLLICLSYFLILYVNGAIIFESQQKVGQDRSPRARPTLS
jgi:hypothetical protein